MAGSEGAQAFGAEASTGTAADRARERDEGFAGGPSASERRAELSPAEELQFELIRNARYHEDRERFFDGVHRWLMFAVVVAGTAAFANLAGQNRTVGIFVALLTTIAGLADLVFDLSGKARTHGSMRRLSFALLGELEGGADLRSIKARLLTSYGDEPAPNGTAGACAYNAAMLAMGRPSEHLFAIGPWRRRFRHFRAGDGDLKTYHELNLHPPADLKNAG
ncbi:hypothetical protein [Kaistia adipata]|uniref:hypothetical protein n=1 Tax=Kaistia adipata TaxID=166954 RepID=UPI0012EB7338|nr:hypothetical protein [Kaistia adipata]